MCLLKRTAVKKKGGEWRDYRDLIILIAIVSEMGSSSRVGNHRLYFIFIFFYRKCLEFSRLACGLGHGGREKTPLRIDELTWKGLFIFPG